MRRPAKRSFSIRGHRTSVSLEDEFWDALKEIAREDEVTLAQMVATIDQSRQGDMGLSGAIRVWLLARYRAKARP